MIILNREKLQKVDISGEMLDLKRNPDGTVSMRVDQTEKIDSTTQAGPTRIIDVRFVPGGDVLSVKRVHNRKFK